MDSFIEAMFEFLDQETEKHDDLEIEISKLISEQGAKNCEELDLTIAELFLDKETANYDGTDIEISKLIPTTGL